MKTLSNLFKRKEGKYSKRKDKKGASLALVMIIGALLVIWVMCIMPLMTSTGTAAHQTFEGYMDYLMNRSSIEFCKSELLKMSKTEIPHTFAVIENDDGTFSAIHNKVSGQTNAPLGDGSVAQPTHYTYYVVDNDVQDDLDVPRDDEYGNKVTAICSVVPTSNFEKFEIIIRTFNNGVPGMTYKVDFTSAGSLKIYPEAYRNNSALPLDDFVVVDGWYGNNHAWDSTITMSNAIKLNFMESLLPAIAEPASGYADTGEYQAVFKTTAHTATSEGYQLLDPIEVGYLSSDEEWEVLVPDNGDNQKKKNEVRFEVKSDGKIYVYLYDGSKNVDITPDCRVYVNGKEIPGNVAPTKVPYKVTVDYKGTNSNEYVKDAYNALPIAGLELGEKGTISTGVQDDVDENYTVRIVQVDEDANGNPLDPSQYTYNAEIGYMDGGQFVHDPSLAYGYLNAKENTDTINWNFGNNVIEKLSAAAGNTYYFYVCRPAALVNGQFKTDSEIKPAGMVFVPSFYDGTSDGSYVVTSEDGQYALTTALSSKELTYQHGFLTSSLSDSTFKVDFGNNSKITLQTNYNTVRFLADVIAKWDTSVQSHRHDWNDYKDCTKYDPKAAGVNNIRLTTEPVNGQLYYARSGATYKIRMNVSSRVTYKPYKDCNVNYKQYSWSSGNNEQTYKDLKWDVYLNPGPGTVGSDTEVAVKFMKPPASEPDVKGLEGPATGITSFTNSAAQIDFTPNPESATYALNYIRSHVNNENAVVYANGEVVEDALNSGVYHIVVKIGNRYGSLGKLTVNRASAVNELEVVAANNDSDELRVDLSSDDWNTNGGYHYFGYRTVEEKNKGKDFHWYYYNDVGYFLRLKYGAYEFAVRETGSNNYKGTTSDNEAMLSVSAAKKMTLTDGSKPFFVYKMDPDTGEITWYDLPKFKNEQNEPTDERVNPARVTFHYGFVPDSEYYDTEWYYSNAQGSNYPENVTISEDGSVKYTRREGFIIYWTITYTLKEYAVTIDNSNYTGTNRYSINKPLNDGVVNNHAPSVMSGEALYFMGESGSIDTHGANVTLTTDLLALNSSIIGTGAVNLYPRSTAPNSRNATLVFAIHDIYDGHGNKIFDAKSFYEVPNDPNLRNINFGNLNINHDKSVFVEGAINKIGGPNDNNVRNLFRGKIYPEVDLNICYATKQQLSRIVSGETIGWTNKGKLSVNSNSTNQNYCVPVFVTGVTGDSSFKANRVLIAGRTDGGNSALNVDKTLKVTTRYLSVDAANMIQGSGSGGFYLYNLGQDQNFIQILSNLLKITNYSSQTLQMDYERSTTVISNSGTQKVMSPQICRYNNGVNLFDFAEKSPNKNSPAPLMAKYTVQDVESLFKGGLTGLSATVKTVDRYIEIVPAGSDTTINISSLLSAQWDLYSNYVYFSPKISLVSLNSWLESDLRFSSQESGYTTDEYLGLFKTHSADSYAGTLIYFGQEAGGSETIRFSIGGTNYDIPRGDFFYIESSESGISIETLAKEIKKEQTIEGYVNPYRATEEELAMIKVYIDLETGQLGGAYVDTGLDDNTDSSMGGFSGGSVG